MIFCLEFRYKTSQTDALVGSLHSCPLDLDEESCVVTPSLNNDELVSEASSLLPHLDRNNLGLLWCRPLPDMLTKLAD